MGILRCEFHREGLCLPELELWLDPREARTGPERVFVSHAHSDHIGRHREVILTDLTARLMRARLGGDRLEHRLDWGLPARFRRGTLDWEVTLLPAGHIPGSAMAWIRAGGESLLYTGDFRLRDGLGVERCQPVPADTLVMETTFGLPRYRFPPAAEVHAAILRFCRETLDNQEVPILLGYSLGKSQEALRLLEEGGLPAAVHPQVGRINRVFEAVGLRFPGVIVADGSPLSGRVLVAPPGASWEACLPPGARTRTAVLTGWALDSGCAYRYGAQAAFPLSDHADFEELLEFAKGVGPRRILTLHGFAREFASTLRDQGFEAQALVDAEQLDLRFDRPTLSTRVRRPPSPASEVVPTEASHAPARILGASGNGLTLEEFARGTAAVGMAQTEADKAAVLAEWFGPLSRHDLGAVVQWIALGSGIDTNQGQQERAAKVAASIVGAAGTVSWESLRAPAGRWADRMEAFVAGWPGRIPESGGPTCAELQSSLEAATREVAGEARGRAVFDRLRRGSAEAVRCLLKVLTGTLRIGLTRGVLREALARRLGHDSGDLARAFGWVGTWPAVVEAAMAGRLQDLRPTPLHPVRLMLPAFTGPPALPVPDENRPQGSAEDAPARGDWVSRVPEGPHVQIHAIGDSVAWFDAMGEEWTPLLPESLLRRSRQTRGDCLLHGVIVGTGPAGERWFRNWTRHRRRPPAPPSGDLFDAAEPPLEFIAVDVLWAEGQAWWDAPWRHRWAWLQSAAHQRMIPWDLPTKAAGSPFPSEESANRYWFRTSSGRYRPGESGSEWTESTPIGTQSGRVRKRRG